MNNNKKKPIYSRLCGYVAQKQLCKDVSGCSVKYKGCENTFRKKMHRKKSNKCVEKAKVIYRSLANFPPI